MSLIEEFEDVTRIKIKELCQEDAEVLASQYQQITSKLYSHQSDQEVMRDLEAVNIFLGVEAQMYNLRGIMAQIHRSLVIEDYDDFEVAELIGYIELMHYDIDDDILEKKNHREIAIMLLQKQLARLENLRIHKFINNVLFLPQKDQPQEFGGADSSGFAKGILYWWEIPRASEIIKRGPLYFYPRIGELTIDELLNKFNYQELFHLAMIFGTVRAGTSKVRKTNKDDIIFVPTSIMRDEDMARAIMLFVENAEFDPRRFLTPQGFNNTYIQEESEQPMSINSTASYTQEDLYTVCTEEGILLYDTLTDERKPDDILFEEYTVVQLSPAFMSHVGSHRSPYSATIRARSPSGSHLWDLALGEIIFYGSRDGITKVDFYTLKELYRSFSQNDDYWDPESLRLFPTNSLMWIKFSRITVRRLLTKILPKMERSMMLFLTLWVRVRFQIV